MGSASSSAVPKMKGQSITEDLLNQDENVFVSKNSKSKGLQQYFTPLKVAGFIRRVVSIHSGVVVDLTAGVGNLLTPFEEDDDIFRLGVELDKSNIPKATSNLHIVNANVAELYPYLLQVEFQPNAIVLNPPFSLFWSCPAITGSDDKKIESQLATVLMAVNMVASSGHGAFLVEKSTWDNSIKLNETVKARVYAVVTAQNVFLPYSAVEAVICFFTGSSRNVPSKPFHASFDLNTPNIDKKLNDIAGEIFGFRKVNYMYLDTFSSKDLKDENVKRFLAAHAEYHARKKAKQQLYNIDYVGGRLKVYLSNYTQFIIDRDYSFSERELVEKMRGVSPSYFAFNTQDKRSLYAMLEEKKVITMSPKAHEAIERAIVEADFILTPMYALKPQQRLGYLEDIGQIKCTKSFIRKTQDSEDEPVLKALRRRDGILRKTSDPSANMFEAGKMYDVSVSTTTVQSFYEKVRGAEGKLTEMIKIGKALSIDIGGCLFSETPEDINLIISHFEIPDPKDVRTKKPRLYDRLRARLESPEFRKFTFKAFQVEDLTRLAMKDAMVLSWEQGLGKTRGSLAWAKLKGARKVLIICPQDLKHQWIAQAATFDIALTEIAGYGDIEKIKNAESGYYIVHYELLKGGRRLDTYVSEYLLNTTDEEGDEHTFNALCPKCKGMREDGWNGRSCKKCGYHVWTRRVKALYTYMKKMFDTVIVDEGVKIKSKHSLQGISVRSLHAKNRLLLSGSPIKGWITDAFWLLHWTLGNASPRFPYHYIGGTEKFLEDFGVFEYVAEEFRKSLSKGKKKLLPEIGNLHLLWKMFAPSIIRRVKAETGEDLAKKTVHRIKVNFTVKQKETYDWWIANFNDWFKASHNTDMEEDNIAMKQMILGLLWKLRFSATVPASPLLPGKPAPGKEETFYPGARSNSNYTEKALFVIGKVKECIAAGEQVVIFSALQDEMNFLKALLERHHFRAEVANATVNPKKRGLLMNDFKARKFDVLVAGIQSVNFGHDLVNASTVIMTDYEWDHSTTRQAIDRVHRLTSTREVNVYMLYTDNAIDWKQLFEVIDRKGQSSDLALDGKLMDQEEAQVDFFKIARELLQSHKMGTGGLLSEEDIEHKISELFMHNLAQSVGVDEGEVAPRPLRLSIGSKPRRGVYVNQIELSL